jgi:hypothetical protein
MPLIRACFAVTTGNAVKLLRRLDHDALGSRPTEVPGKYVGAYAY